MKPTALLFFPVLLLLVFTSSCNDGNKTVSGTASNNGTPPELLKKVSYFSNETTIAATYFCADTNWAELAKALWKEKTKLMAGKDSSVTYFLIVFNEADRTPDITKDYNIAWNQDYNHYRSCTIDNGLGFARFCFGIRYDMGRVGDWAHIRYVNPDGSLTEEQ